MNVKNTFVLLFLLSMLMLPTKPAYAVDLNNVRARLWMICSGVSANQTPVEISVYLSLYNPMADAIIGYKSEVKIADKNGTKSYLLSMLKGAKYTTTPPADELSDQTQNIQIVVTALDESNSKQADQLVIDFTPKTNVATGTWAEPFYKVPPTPVKCSPVEMPTPPSP